MTFEHQSAPLWSPYLEWTIKSPTKTAYETDAIAIFTHTDTGETIRTGIFPLSENVWAFRFANSTVGDWSFTTESADTALNGHAGQVTIAPNPAARGTLTHKGHWWTWSETGDVIVPQLAMYETPDGFHRNSDQIAEDIHTFFEQHGFNGFHVPVFCRWLDIDKEANPEFTDTDPMPDPRTFEALESLITRVWLEGGLVHLWLWGDNDANHKMTPMRDDWGGKNGRVAHRLYRYIADRLGPVTGWSMGYGFDLEHWVEEEDLRLWHDTMTARMGWPHLLGGRSGRPKDGPELLQIYDGLDYAGYTHLRPSYDEYLRTVRHHPDKPVFSEDRFRIRKSERHKAKDYDEERTRLGLWHSVMAGGVANIWGKMAEGEVRGRSAPYPNAELLLTATRFFEGRLSSDMAIDETLSDGCALRSAKRIILYKEDCDSIQLSEEIETANAVGVDARKPYREDEITIHGRTVSLPSRSDWAVSVELA